MRVRRVFDGLFIACNLLAIGLLSVSFVQAEASSDLNQTVLSASTSNVPAPQYAEVQLQELAQKINQVRAEKGLQPLKQSSALDSVADARAEDMAKNAYYAHRSPSGQFFDDVMKSQGIKVGTYACENLNMAEAADAENFVQTWLASKPHKDCLLDRRITSAGYAIAKIHVSNGVPINQYVVVAIYGQPTT